MLNELALKYGSDKGRGQNGGHGYANFYEHLFEHFREKEALRILEIGLARGGPEIEGHSPDRIVPAPPSIQMWLDFFPKAHVIGFDISDFSRYMSDRFTFVQGDSGSTDDLIRLKDAGPYDLIIDDGSHASYHQLMMLQSLFPSLTYGGNYIIEDMDWQPSHLERALPKTPLMRSILLAYPDREKMRRLIGNKDSGNQDWIDQTRSILILGPRDLARFNSDTFREFREKNKFWDSLFKIAIGKSYFWRLNALFNRPKLGNLRKKEAPLL